ncbi:MAG: CCA tRNA nucleotidyltransferase [Parvibaculales bacterium]
MTTPVIRADWLIRPQTRKLFELLGPANLRAVGGCVRDSLSGHVRDNGKQAVDVDMATSLVPEAVVAHLTQADVKVVPTGVKYGTVTAILDGFHYEITTLRQDVETDGRHARVVYGEDWVADARRRDFTVNALYCDAAGHVEDPLGCGLADLAAGRVVFIGDAKTRIREDYLRVFRFFRFHALIGAGAPDKTALAACRQAAQDGAGLKQLSGERLYQELMKMLAIRQPVAALELMHGAGVLAHTMPVSGLQNGLERLSRLVAYDSQVIAIDPLVRLAGLLAHVPADIAMLADHLRLSNREQDRITALLTNPYHDTEITPDNQLQLAYRLGPQLCIELLLLQQSAAGHTPDIAGLKTAVRDLKNLVIPVFPVTGKTLLQAGFEAGPEIGRILAALENWWVETGFEADESALLARLEEMTASNAPN